MLQKLLLEIETVRKELNKELEKNDLKINQDKILALSSQLDQLILKYIKSI